MAEMSPQEAAAVWTRVPEVEQQLTPRVVGLSNVLTGLAIASVGIPMAKLLPGAVTWVHPYALAAYAALIGLFLGLRAGLWNVYGLAKPEGRTLLYRYRTPGSWSWLPVDWWYLAAFAWGFALMWWAGAPDPLRRSASLIPLMVTVYTVAGGVWESRRSWCRRPYLLAAGVLCCAVGWGLQIAGVLGWLMVLLGLAWVLAGIALYHQV